MATGVVVPLYRSADDLTGHTTGAVTGGRFLAISGNVQSGPGLSNAGDGGNIRVAHAGAGLKSVGVAGCDAGTGKKVPIYREPNMVIPMVADGAITAGDDIEVGTAGKPKTKASGVKVGTAYSTATDGNTVLVALFL